jgi:hypothetical protein
LAGHRSDAVEVPVAMQQCQALQFGRGGHDEVHRSGAAVLSLPGQHLLDVRCPVRIAVHQAGQGAGADEELRRVQLR